MINLLQQNASLPTQLYLSMSKSCAIVKTVGMCAPVFNIFCSLNVDSGKEDVVTLKQFSRSREQLVIGVTVGAPVSYTHNL